MNCRAELIHNSGMKRSSTAETKTRKKTVKHAAERFHESLDLFNQRAQGMIVEKRKVIGVT